MRAGSRRGLLPVLIAGLFLAHAGLAFWGVTRNSVTFDENSHVASGLAMLTRGNAWVSVVNPPLVKLAYGAAARAAGARLPDDGTLDGRDQFTAGESVMRANAGHYHRVFAAARAVNVLLSLALATLVWLTARRLYGAAAGGLALALYALCPETLAHGGLATLDTATALFSFASLLAFCRFARSGSGRGFAVLAVAFSALALTRFTAWMVWGVLALLAVAAVAGRFTPHRLRLLLGTAALVPLAVLTLDLAYPGPTSLAPLSAGRFSSQRFQQLQQRSPGLVVPLPDAYLAGLDHQMYESQPGMTPTYFRGRITREAVPLYTPVAIAVKWPLSLWAALFLAAFALARRRSRPSPGEASTARFEPIALAALAAAFLVAPTLFVRLNVGVRYLLPAIPVLCVLASRPLFAAAGGRSRQALAVAIGLGAAIETASCAPWYLSFFNAAAGGPGRGDRIVNDTNVDAGQGLIALREELDRLEIRRVHLAYHGTVDPALYGIDAIPYLGGEPGTQSDWIAISSYYFVGLSQRMMTASGRTPFVSLQFEPLWNRPPAARPANCMYLFRIRAPALSPP